jgi:uncharacterized protein YbbC (DUF1343 family)
VEGPLLTEGFRSFVGLHRIPIRHGMTLGELALMINESGWLGSNLKADLTVVPVMNWRREAWQQEWGLTWIPPSPNLPDVESVWAYPGTCLLEGTNVSEGRGTALPFITVGAPWMDSGSLMKALQTLPPLGFVFEPITFTPRSRPGSRFPKHEDRVCHGIRIRTNHIQAPRPVALGIHLIEILSRLFPDDFVFLDDHFIDKLYGSDDLRTAIDSGGHAPELMEGWAPALERFKAFRDRFLIY